MARHRGQPYVYFVRRADGEGPVKIGCSAVPESRLSSLMCWSPYRLALLAQIPGDEVLERRFHAAFQHAHSHREWFYPSDDLLAAIAAVQARGFDTSTLPPPKTLYKNAKPWTQFSKDRLHADRALTRLAKAGVLVPDHLRHPYWWRMTPVEQQARLDEMKAFVEGHLDQVTVTPNWLRRAA